MPIGLPREIQHLHTSPMIWDARFQCLKWSFKIHVMGLTKIGNNKLFKDWLSAQSWQAHHFGYIQWNKGIHCICERRSKWAMDSSQEWNIYGPLPTQTVQSPNTRNLLFHTCCGKICEIHLYKLLWKRLCFAIHRSIGADRYSKTSRLVNPAWTSSPRIRHTACLRRSWASYGCDLCPGCLGC